MHTATARVVKALKRSEDVASEFGHEHVGTEHLMIGLLADPHGIGTQVVAKHADVRVIIEEIRAILGSDSYNRPVPQPASSEPAGRLVPPPKLSLRIPGQ